jgi:hypothetical protein
LRELFLVIAARFGLSSDGGKTWNQ